MLKQVILEFLPEITAIEARTDKILSNNSGYVIQEERFGLDRENRVWLPLLCLASGRIARSINNKVVKLAAIIHLVNYASRLHWIVPEECAPEEAKQKLQYPILIGDYLYSQVYFDLCKHGLREYLLPLTSLISSIHEELIYRDYCRQNGFPEKKHEIKIFAMMSESACFLGAHTATGSTYIVEKLRKLGYHLGILRGVWESDEDIFGYASSWYRCWDVLQQLPENSVIRQINDILIYMGDRWELEKPEHMNKSIV